MTTVNLDQLLFNVVLATVFSVLGFALLFAGYRALDALTPLQLSRQIFDEGSLGAALLAGGFVVGLALLAAAGIRG